MYVYTSRALHDDTCAAARSSCLYIDRTAVPVAFQVYLGSQKDAAVSQPLSLSGKGVQKLWVKISPQFRRKKLSTAHLHPSAHNPASRVLFFFFPFSSTKNNNPVSPSHTTYISHPLQATPAALPLPRALRLTPTRPLPLLVPAPPPLLPPLPRLPLIVKPEPIPGLYTFYRSKKYSTLIPSSFPPPEKTGVQVLEGLRRRGSRVGFGVDNFPYHGGTSSVNINLRQHDRVRARSQHVVQ